MRRLLLIFCGAMLLVGSGCGTSRRGGHGPIPTVAVASPYLAAAVQDVLGPDEPVLVLAEPGNCPGHFDLRPDQVQQLRDARLLLRFDFQARLDRGLGSAVDAGLRIVSLEPLGGLGVTTTYLDLCGQIADAAVRDDLLGPAAAEHRLGVIARRLEALDAAMRRDLRQAGLKDLVVAADRHQAMFCRSVGLTVGMELLRSENPRTFARMVQACGDHGVKLVVGNRPQGENFPATLAGRLGVKVVMLANFPAVSREKPYQPAFDAMVRGNVERLIRAAGP